VMNKKRIQQNTSIAMNSISTQSICLKSNKM